MPNQFKTPDFSKGAIKSNKEVTQAVIDSLQSEITELEEKARNGDERATGLLERKYNEIRTLKAHLEASK